MPCSPEESQQLAELLAHGRLGEVQGLSIDIPTEPPAQGATSPRLGPFHTARTMRAALGDWFGVNVVDPIIRKNIERDNFVSAEFKAFKEAMAPVQAGGIKGWFRGIPKEVDEQVGQALEFVDRGGHYFGAPNQFSPEVLQAARNVRALYDRMFDRYVVDPDKYLKGYMPHLRKRPDGIMWREEVDLNADEVMFRKQLKTDDIVFYHEMERTGTIPDPELRASTTFLSYINGIGKAKILKPAVEDLEREHVNPFFGLKMYRSLAGNTYTVANDAAGYAFWREYVHHLFGGPTPSDFTNAAGIRKLTQMFGYNIDTRSLYKFSQGLTNLQYSGALGGIGGRPASILRQFTQLVPTYAVLGAKHTMAGIQRVMTEGVQPLIERNMISSPLEHLIEAVDVQKALGRTISNVSELSLKAFSSVDRFTRAATAYAAESKFNEYHARGIFDKLKIRKDLKDEVTRLYNSGDIVAARERYMFSTVNDLQYAFGRANRPKTFRGAIRGLGSVFLSYPLNTAELVRMVGTEAFKEGNIAPAVRLMGTTIALMTVGSEMLNADMRSATLLGALPHSMAFPKTALDAYKVGTTSFDWLIGNTFGVGESDFAKYQRNQSYAALGRDAKGLVPGGLFFFQDIPKAIDEGSIARWAALTPKAEQLNQYARESAAASASTRERPLPTLRGIQ